MAVLFPKIPNFTLLAVTRYLPTFMLSWIDALLSSKYDSELSAAKVYSYLYKYFPTEWWTFSILHVG